MKENSVSEDMNLARQLRDDRQKLWHDAKALMDRERAESRSLTAEENTQLDGLMDRIDKTDARMKDVVNAEKRSRETDEAYNEMTSRPAERAVAGRDSEFEENLRKFVLGDPYVKRVDIPRQSTHTLDGDEFRSIAYRQRAASKTGLTDDVQLRTLGTAGAGMSTQGSAVVPVDFYDRLIAYLIEVSGILQTGPTVWKTTGGEAINVPVATAHVTAASAAQGGVLPTSEPALTQKSLGAAKFAHMVFLSRELIDDKAVDLLGYLAMSAGRAIGNAFGSALVLGGQGITGGLIPSISQGVSGAPSASAIAQGQVAGGAVYNDLVDMEYSIIAPYRQSRSCYWLAADKTIGGFRKLKDNNARPLWEPSAVLGAPDLLLGKPIVADPYVPAIAPGNKSLVFGDFSQYVVRLVGGLRFERSDDFKFDSDVVSFRAVIRGDGNVMDSSGLKYFIGNAA
jgi:HK97 family phage major capsid protein